MWVWLLHSLGLSIAAEVSDSKKPRHITEEVSPLDGSLEMDTQQQVPLYPHLPVV